MKLLLPILSLILFFSCANSSNKNSKLQDQNLRDQSRNNPAFIRELLLDDGQYVVLVRNKNNFQILPQEYSAVIDPYIIKEDSYKAHDEFSSRAHGFYAYKNHRFNDQYIAVKVNSLWGFIDIEMEGSYKIAPQYENVHPYKEDLAAVKIKEKWGFIDVSNKIVIPPIYTSVEDFYNGKCIVEFSDNSIDMIGAIDTSGHLLFKYVKGESFNAIFDFYENNLARAYDKYWGTNALDSKGTIVQSQISNPGDRGGPFDPCFNFNFGTNLCTMACFNQSEYDNQINKSESGATFYGAFNKLGQWTIKPIFQDYDEVREKTAIYLQDNIMLSVQDLTTNTWGYKTNKDNWVIQPSFEYAYDFKNNFAIVKSDGNYGVINLSGSWAIQPIYSQLMQLSDNYYIAELDEKYGIIDSSGKIVIKLNYTLIGRSYNKNYPIYVEIDNKKGFINANEEWLITGDENDSFVEYKNGIAFKYTQIPFESGNSFDIKYSVKIFDANGNNILNQKNYYEIYHEPEI